MCTDRFAVLCVCCKRTWSTVQAKLKIFFKACVCCQCFVSECKRDEAGVLVVDPTSCRFLCSISANISVLTLHHLITEAACRFIENMHVAAYNAACATIPDGKPSRLLALKGSDCKGGKTERHLPTHAVLLSLQRGALVRVRDSFDGAPPTRAEQKHSLPWSRWRGCKQQQGEQRDK